MKGLIIRDPWITKILRGTKTWEMRGKPTGYRGAVALIRQGTGLVVGIAEITDSLPALDLARYHATRDRHGIPVERDAEVLRAGWVCPWVLENVRVLKRSVASTQKPGAVTWVTLPTEVIAKVQLESGAT
jgi:hypothetical protein